MWSMMEGKPETVFFFFFLTEVLGEIATILQTQKKSPGEREN